MISKNDSFYLGHLGPIPLYVHWTFIFLVWFIVARYSHGPDGLVNGLAALTIFILGIVLHELGHGMASLMLGGRDLSITLWTFGGVCSSTGSERPWRMLIVVLAGPLVSALLAGGSLLALMLLDQYAHHTLYDTQNNKNLLNLLLTMGFHINLSLLIFNMLPIFPLDGGQAVFNLMLMFLRREIAKHISLFIAVLGSIAYVLWDCGYDLRNINMMLAAVLGFCVYEAFIYFRFSR